MYSLTIKVNQRVLLSSTLPTLMQLKKLVSLTDVKRDQVAAECVLTQQAANLVTVDLKVGWENETK